MLGFWLGWKNSLEISRRTGCLFGSRCSLWPLLGFTVSIDDLLVPTDGIVIAQRKHFAEGIKGGLVVAHFPVDRSQPLEENGAVVRLRGGVVTGRLGRQTFEELVSLTEEGKMSKIWS